MVVFGKLLASCRDEWVARPAAHGVAALVGAFAIGVLAASAPATAAAADVARNPLEATQEVTFAALGLGDQTVHGPAGSILTYFPAPPAPLAPSGNFVRVFFGHDAPDDPAATLAVTVNGAPLAVVPLNAGTRAGGVFEKEVPAAMLHPDRPNRLEVRFSLVPPGRPASADLYGQLGSRTLLHYELRALDGGAPDALEDYPAGLLGPSGAQAGPAPLALFLPSQPDTTEVAAMARLMADLGRRARSYRVEPQVSPTDPVGWLGSASSPALMVGRLDRLPAAGGILQRAGFTRTPEGWRPPRAASAVPADAGIVAVTETPDARGKPVLLVSGGSDRAVVRAADALIGGQGAQLSGRYAVVDRDSGGAADVPGADPLKLSALLGDDPSPQGSGEHRLVFSLPARAADPDGRAQLRLQFDPGAAAGEGVPVVVEVNGHVLEVSRPAPASGSSASAYVTVPGRFLRVGLNQVALVLRLSGGRSPTLASAASTFQAPPPPRRDIGLAALPYPFLDGDPASSTTLVLPGLDGATLQAVAATFVTMGSRAIAPPPPATVRFLFGNERIAETSGSLVVVGSPPWVRQVGLRVDPAGELVIRPPASGPGQGWVVRQGPLLGSLQVLWVGGDDGQAAARAALALGDTATAASVLVVGPDGRPLSGAGSAVDITRPTFETWLPRLLPIGAALLLLLLLLGSQALSRGLRGREAWQTSWVAALVVLGWCCAATLADMVLAPRTSAAFFAPAVLVVGALSLRTPKWQGVAAAVLAAAALESIETFLSGSRVLVTLGAGGGQAPSRLTALMGASEIVRTLAVMGLLLATPLVAAL
ncbi:MAG: cellulose biosynthesis cyclic di-GMP-binding regulatory protein BcsB, partial [Candidatus Dormibacteraeota bacterium]|nr:cellulose biosynthesis cyclic di-GMP-binding regulatory protein BcsB [Candidatus Dormibacteraeota bacterium]